MSHIHNDPEGALPNETREAKIIVAALADCDVENLDITLQEDNVDNDKLHDDDLAGRNSISERKESDHILSTVQNNEESNSESDNSEFTQEIDKTEEKEEPPQVTAIGNKESRDINRFKIFVILILLTVAIVASTCVLVFIKKAEQRQFEEAFHANAIKVLESVRNSIDNTLMPMDNLAVALVSHARAHNQEWPFVMLEDFAVRVAKVLPLTDAIYISVLPLVTPATRLQWENYSRTHDDWVEESFAIQDTWELYYGPKNLTNNPEVAEWEEWALQVSGPFGPLEANTRCGD
jgi:hypothetical protein